MIPDADAMVRISAALIAAMTEARAMVEAGDCGPGFVELLQHAKEMHTLMMQELGAAGDGAAEYSRGLAHAMGDRLAALEALLSRAGAGH